MTTDLSSGEKRKRGREDSTIDDSLSERPRVIGPTIPHIRADSSNNAQERNTLDDNSEESDDDFGPQLPPATHKQSVGTKLHDQTSLNKPQEGLPEEHPSKPGKRDEWMVVPPSKDSWVSGLRSAPAQNRKFMTGRSARGSETTDGTGSAWTESPAQKKQRLENEILGIQSHSSSADTKAQSHRADITTADKLKMPRGEEKKPSLYERHKQRKRSPGADDPSARPFDREKDIAGPTNVSNANRKEMLNRASDYGSRFSGGKYL
ncbi:hypothetical protein BGW36DRAFT_308951 [Talaromyces proteolyticus]|uniref:DUF3752 domain-containing protein n=1 Tax=Talaromyces proteolyticus TaxID=1131652 RepID=A0AAD4KIR4_9EURO|nr:uncharacterized protein BGW36DRAFT_308951 [Talaromyces proteolyticus]KAH8689216.1 hypothetical protein BGW36DRAFT_308951 [Talaromyces proteolyticus]